MKRKTLKDIYKMKSKTLRLDTLARQIYADGWKDPLSSIFYCMFELAIEKDMFLERIVVSKTTLEYLLTHYSGVLSIEEINLPRGYPTGAQLVLKLPKYPDLRFIYYKDLAKSVIAEIFYEKN